VSVTIDCAEACEAAPRCTVCGLTKKPIGRDAPLEMANGLCGDDCPGYRKEPRAGHLRPGELATTVHRIDKLKEPKRG